MKPQATSKKNTAKLTAALSALILLFPCCMDSTSGGNSSGYDSGSDTGNNGSWENPDDPDAPENPDDDDSTGGNNGEDSGNTEPDEPKPDTPDNPESTTEIDSSTDMSKLNPAKTYIFKATDGTVDAAKLVLAKKILGENLSFTETDVNYTLDFSNKSFADTTNEIESRSEYASKKGLTSSTSIITDENLTETIKIGDVEFITKPIYYKGDNDKVIQQAFKFGKNVDNVKVTFGNSHSMTEAYKGGIILENSNATIEADNIASTTLTGNLYAETMEGLSENSLMKKLTEASKLPTLEFLIGFLGSNWNYYGTGIDKIFENYYKTGNSGKVSLNALDAPFDAKDALNGEFMYKEDGTFNRAYNLDINTALLMAEKLTNEIKNVNISGNMTSDKDATFIPTNVRFSGNVSGLNFTTTSGCGLIDFAGVGPKYISAPSAKIVVKGVGDEGKFLGRVVDLSSLSKDVLSKVSTKSQNVGKVYLPTGVEKSDFTGGYAYSEYDNGSSASTNRAWEEAGRNGTLPSDSLSKLDGKAKANNPLLQKLLDENRPVYG